MFACVSSVLVLLRVYVVPHQVDLLPSFPPPCPLGVLPAEGLPPEVRVLVWARKRVNCCT